MSTPADLPSITPERQALRHHVLTHSVRRGDFVLKSGARSSWFLDTKQTACRPDGILALTAALAPLIPESADSIGGLTMGADPVAFGVAAVLATHGRPLRSFSIRQQSKGHGVVGRIAGAFEPGDQVVITEDTTTRGTSLLDAVEVIRELGGEVVLATSIVDRGTTCTELCAAAEVPYTALLTATDLGFEPGT